MRQQIYSIFDNKVKTFSNPFYTTHDQLAIRQATAVVNDNSTTLSQYPDDFELWNMGIWDDSGKFSDINPKKMVPLSKLKKPEVQNGKIDENQNSLNLQSRSEDPHPLGR